MQALSQALSLKELPARLLVLRGIREPGEARRFLDPKLEDLTPPSRILDLPKAVDRLAAARVLREKVRVFSDYDVDGTCGGALLTRVFLDLGFDASVTQPDRFKDGYGLNEAAVETAARDGIRVLVTVDCGITSFDAARKACALGIDLIIVDHHQIDVARGLPEAFAVIDPHRADCASGLTMLCGTGLAFYLSIALRSRAREEDWLSGKPLPNLKTHLDLVTLATAADMVPLVGDNRILIKHGLEVIKRSSKPGLRALLEVAGLGSKDFSPSHLGFTLGPRINASGRIANADLAMELLLTDEVSRAWTLAQELERLNAERMEIQNRIWDSLKTRVEKEIAEGKHPHAVVVTDPSWHEGVVGIVASRVAEHFRRPAVVMSTRETDCKGSARSFAGRDVLSALRESREWIHSFGGHVAAAGLTLKPENLDGFAEAFNQAMGAQSHSRETPPLLVDAELEASELDLPLFHELERLAPFGPGNPEPLLIVAAVSRQFQWLKERHLKLRLGGAGGESSIEALWFHADRERLPQEGGLARFAVIPEISRFRGRMTPQLRIRDFRTD